jgi:predicted transcriptional regulator
VNKTLQYVVESGEMNIKNFKFDSSGLDRFFGPLEAKIMEILWDKNELSIKEVQNYLEKEKAINFNTVMTVMKRLVEKGILSKRLQGRLSLFKPVQTKEEFINEQSKKLSENLLDEFGGIVINHMLDAMEDVDQNLLDQLEKKIQQLKRDKS